MEFEIYTRNPDAGDNSREISRRNNRELKKGDFSYKVLKALAEVSSSVLRKDALASEETGYPVRRILS